MILKRLILVIILFSGILGCECFNGGTEWNIDGIDVTIFDKDYRVPINGVIEGDSVIFHLVFEPDFVEHNSNPLRGLMNSAFATSCVHPGDYGLEDEIAEFIITSNSMFNAIPIGEPLNELILVNGEESITDWISTSDIWTFRHDKIAKLMFTEKPEASSMHIFTVKFVLESGMTIEQSTEEIQWN